MEKRVTGFPEFFSCFFGEVCLDVIGHLFKTIEQYLGWDGKSETGNEERRDYSADFTGDRYRKRFAVGVFAFLEVCFGDAFWVDCRKEIELSLVSLTETKQDWQRLYAA